MEVVVLQWLQITLRQPSGLSVLNRRYAQCSLTPDLSSVLLPF